VSAGRPTPHEDSHAISSSEDDDLDEGRRDLQARDEFAERLRKKDKEKTKQIVSKKEQKVGDDHIPSGITSIHRIARVVLLLLFLDIFYSEFDANFFYIEC